MALLKPIRWLGPSQGSTLFRTIRHCLALVLTVIGIVAPGIAAETGATSKIVYINSYHRGYSWSDDIERGLREGLEASGRNIELSVEYLDSRRFAAGAQLEPLARSMEAKFRSYRPDLVVVSDNAAFDFAIAQRQRLFPGLPIIFCGYNNFRPEVIGGIDNITGVNEEIAIQDTVAMALKLHPKARTLAFVVSTGDASSKRIGEIAEESVFPALRQRFDVVVLKDAAVSEIRDRLATLPADSLLFLSGQAKDQGNGRALSPPENAALITAVSPFPAYTFWDFHLGRGVVGGHILTGADQGGAAASLALRILAGESAGNIPVMMTSPTTDVFDYPVLQRFGIDPARLPAEAVLINRPDTLWHEHRREILWAAAIFALQSLSILLLVRSMRARRDALEKLQAERALLEQRVAERTAELTRSEAQMRAILDTVQVAIFMVDMRGRITHANLYMSKMFGRSPESLLGSEYVSLIHPSERAEGHTRMLQLMASTIQSVDLDRLYWRDEGSEFWGHLNGIRLVDSNKGKTIGLIGVIADINERKLAKEELERHKQDLEKLVEERTKSLEEATRAAEAANRAKTIFLGNMSHELRTPLHQIFGLLTLLRRDSPDENQRKRLEMLQSSCGRMEAVVSGILNLVDIESRSTEIKLLPLDPQSLLDEAIARLAERAGGKNLRLESRTDSLPPHLLGDGKHIATILSCFGDNALTFSEQGKITLRAFAESEDAGSAVIRFEVEDQGIGIAPEDAARLFNIFEQADNSPTRKYGGTGIGLALARKLARLMGGDAGYRKNPDVGSTFWATVRLIKADWKNPAIMNAAHDYQI